MSWWLFPLALAGGPADPWEATLDAAIPSVVNLRYAVPRTFDTDGAGVFTATGFVVDAERGILLSNRHVVHTGPIVAEAVFADNEALPIEPIYRDPVHDFGFFRYDPAALRFLRPASIPLDPDGAQVGVSVRVIGSDNAEKISILSGVIARIDRNAPDYGRGRYNDFDTFYIQAASSTSGGSSGSPVLDVLGHAVALNAGSANNAASSYYLPLERIVRALRLVQAGEDVPRGTVQAVSSFLPWDEVQRLGLPQAVEASWRAQLPGASGMLTIASVVPEGPADGALAPGDVLVEADGRPVADYVTWEGLLDAHVGGALHVVLIRGGARVEVDLVVQDLHAITPDRFLDLGRTVLHPLSFEQAVSYAIPVRGVQVASAGPLFESAGVPARAVLTRVGGEPVGDLRDLAERFAAVPDHGSIGIEYLLPWESKRRVSTSVAVDAVWAPARICERDGGWTCEALPQRPEVALPPGRAARPVPANDAVGRRLAPSLVWVEGDIPYRVLGATMSSFAATGVVVDAERGLIVVDRDAVPLSTTVVHVTVGGSLRVPGQVVAVHPFHELALVRVDPSLLAPGTLRAVPLADAPARIGARAWEVGLTEVSRLRTRRGTVRDVRLQTWDLPSRPAMREVNLVETFMEEDAGAASGVILSPGGRLLAFSAWIRDYSSQKAEGSEFGVPVDVVRDLLDGYGDGAAPRWRALGAELDEIDLGAARERGLPDDAAARWLAGRPATLRVPVVVRRAGGTSAAEVLRDGDLLLAVGDVEAPSVADLDRAGRASGPVRLRLCRDGVVQEVQVEPVELGSATERIVRFAGGIFQDVPWEAAIQRGVPMEGVFLAGFEAGTPAQRWIQEANLVVREVDGRPVPDLDAFLDAVRGAVDGAPVRLRVISMDGRETVVTPRADLVWWPTVVFERGPRGWSQRSWGAEPAAPPPG